MVEGVGFTCTIKSRLLFTSAHFSICQKVLFILTGLSAYTVQGRGLRNSEETEQKSQREEKRQKKKNRSKQSGYYTKEGEMSLKLFAVFYL